MESLESYKLFAFLEVLVFSFCATVSLLDLIKAI